MKKINGIIALTIAALLIASVLPVIGCGGSGGNVAVDESEAQRPQSMTTPKWDSLGESVQLSVSYLEHEKTFTANELFALGTACLDGIDKKNGKIRGGSRATFNGVYLKHIIADAFGDGAIDGIAKLVITAKDGTRTELVNDKERIVLLESIFALQAGDRVFAEDEGGSLVVKNVDRSKLSSAITNIAAIEIVVDAVG